MSFTTKITSSIAVSAALIGTAELPAKAQYLIYHPQPVVVQEVVYVEPQPVLVQEVVYVEQPVQVHSGLGIQAGVGVPGLSLSIGF